MFMLLCHISVDWYHMHVLPLLCSRTQVSHDMEPLYTSGALIFFSYHSGNIPWLSGSGDQGAWIPWLHTAIKIKEMVTGKLPFPVHCSDSRLNLSNQSLYKRPTYIFRNFGLRGRLLVWHTLMAYVVISGHRGQWTQFLWFSSPSLQFIVFLRKFIPLFDTLIFITVVRGYLYLAWLWWSGRLIIMDPTRM